jgi:imidazolonepropionase-like amidohydrolase
MLLLFVGGSAPAETVLIRAGGYVDVGQGKLIKPAVVLVEDGRIRSVNPDSPPQADRSIDLGKRILLPGLMDMHVHLDFDFAGGDFGIVVTESGSEGTLVGVRNAELTLMAGFTTVRNIGQVHPTLDMIDVALANASDAGDIRALRIVPAGHMITILGGHGDLSTGEGLSEGMLELDPARGVISGVDEAVRASRFQIKHGAKTIKIHATAGVLSLEESVGARQLTDEEMKAIVEEAGRHDIPVAAHAHGTEGIKAAIRAGWTPSSTARCWTTRRSSC